MRTPAFYICLGLSTLFGIGAVLSWAAGEAFQTLEIQCWVFFTIFLVVAVVIDPPADESVGE